MRNLQIIGNVPQVRRESNFGEYAEEAVIIDEQPKVKKENPHFLEANTLEVTMQHLKEDCITPVFAKDNELTIPHPAFIDTVYDAANAFFSGDLWIDQNRFIINLPVRQINSRGPLKVS